MPDTVRTQTDLIDLFRDGQPEAAITAQDVRDFIKSTYKVGRQTIIAQKADLPLPVAGVITLDAATDYHFVDSVDLGTDVISLIDGSSISGSSGLVTIQTASATALLTTSEALGIDAISLFF